MTTPPEPDEQAADARQTDTLHVDEVSADISDVYWIDAPVLIIFWILLGIVMLQFVTRYVFNDSVGWTEEIARYLLIFLTFIGSVTCVRQGAHIFLEFFYRYV
ncbi:MAG: TRAP transporter small permease subunit, partial [Candidatus Competibacteraceae bacterium]|nr:TRAP transporter small permease subunit [Candidatus Competibacteraceae bacterium]